MSLRYGINQLKIIINKAKPGENVTQEDYDTMVSILKLAKDMQKTRCAAQVIAHTMLISFVATLAIKYGYDVELGQKIETVVLPAGVAGCGGVALLKKRLIRLLYEAKAKADKLHNNYLSRMFR